jgi:hypothetical protein
MAKVIDYLAEELKHEEEALTLVCLHCGSPTEDVFCNEACKREWEERDEQLLRDRVARFLYDLEAVRFDLPKVVGPRWFAAV